MINNPVDTLALATIQIRNRSADRASADPRIIAVGMVRVSHVPEGNAHFDIDAFALDPGMPSEEGAAELARWLVSQSAGPAFMINWRIDDPLTSGLRKIAAKIEPQLARDLMVQFELWSAGGAVDLSLPCSISGDASLEEAALRRGVDFIPFRAKCLEPCGARQRKRLRETAATAAMASWCLWWLQMGDPPDAQHDGAAAFAQWLDHEPA